MQCEERPAAPSPHGEGAANESVGLLCLDAPFKLLRIDGLQMCPGDALRIP